MEENVDGCGIQLMEASAQKSVHQLLPKVHYKSLTCHSWLVKLGHWCHYIACKR